MYKQILMVAVGYVVATLIIFSGFIVLIYLHNTLGKTVFALTVVIGFATMILFLYRFNNPKCPQCGRNKYKWYELFTLKTDPRQCSHCRNSRNEDENIS